MNVANVGDLSLGQWFAIVRAWNRANGDVKVAPPTEEEFDLAMMRARGVA